MTTFNQVYNTHANRLGQFIPVVDRVHGAHHPEFHEVKDLWETIHAKVESNGSDTAELCTEFSQLRQVTNDYTIPNDVCESYAAVYTLLKEVDDSYASRI